MANFPRQKPTGFAMFELLASAIATAWDVCISKAVNGDDGSAHDGDVTLGSLTTNRDVHTTQDVVSDRDVLVDRNLDVSGATTLFTLETSASAILAGDLSVGGSTSLFGVFTATLDAHFDQDLTVSGQSSLTDATVTGQFTVSNTGNTLFNSRVDFGTSASYISRRRHLQAVPSSTGTQYDSYQVDDPGSPGTITLNDPSGTGNPRMRFTSTEVINNTVTFVRATDSSALCQFNGLTPDFCWVDVEWDGSDWTVSAWGGGTIRLI